MRSKTLPLVVLVGALAALVASVGWAATRDGDNGWTMMRYGAAGMMGYAADGGERVLGLADAKLQAQRFADRLDLEVGEVMRFTNHYYAELEERDGTPATEVLVDPETGNVYLEYGPAMMWNTRYGMMSDFRLRGSEGMMGGGMMGGGSTGGMMSNGSAGGMMGGGMMGGSGGMMGGSYADPTWTPGATTGAVSAAKARALATRWLDRQGGNVTAGEPEAFPGYYTLHVLRNGRIAGMLSVNAATGTVWSHWWHGRFVSMLEA
ncbi:MAG: hypothetical protein KatS3mg012_0660 [Gaiellaceae bacterium]|nr:MAG: hypothetical protein KatS3mg012_0660 [Gaiellaceae bacterium]